MVQSMQIDKEKLLCKSFIFEALDPDTKQKLAKASRVQGVAAGDQIFAMGTPGNSMIAIAQGSVRITVQTPTARDMVLADLNEGDVFGEIAMLDGKERSADAKALTNCTLVVLERSIIMRTMAENPELPLHLINTLCARVRRSDERMLDLAFLQLPSRLAKTLLRLSDGPPVQKKLSLSQSELADMLGSSRENVNRCLRKWQNDGIIKMHNGWLILQDRDTIERVLSR